MNNRITENNQPKIDLKSLFWYLFKPINYVQENLVCLIRGGGEGREVLCEVGELFEIT